MATEAPNAPGAGGTIAELDEVVTKLDDHLNAIGAGIALLTRSSQYRNAEIMPIAPCAKLKIPDVA